MATPAVSLKSQCTYLSCGVWFRVSKHFPAVCVDNLSHLHIRRSSVETLGIFLQQQQSGAQWQTLSNTQQKETLLLILTRQRGTKTPSIIEANKSWNSLSLTSAGCVSFSALFLFFLRNTSWLTGITAATWSLGENTITYMPRQTHPGWTTFLTMKSPLPDHAQVNPTSTQTGFLLMVLAVKSAKEPRVIHVSIIIDVIVRKYVHIVSKYRIYLLEAASSQTVADAFIQG